MVRRIIQGPPIQKGKTMSETPAPKSSDLENHRFADALRPVIEALNNIKFGAIQLTVHDGRLVQVDITERRRFGG